MAHYQVIIAYDGTNFQGFQRQGSSRTVQAEIEAALHHLDWQGDAIFYAGRTDSGVHASGQVIAFDLEWAHPPEALGRALNAHLPADIAARDVSSGSSGFSSTLQCDRPPLPVSPFLPTQPRPAA